MGLFSRFTNKINLKQLLKDAPITYKLNDKGDEIQLFGQSFYRTDPTEIMLNPEHTSIILYGHGGRNIYGICGNGLLETATWEEWTEKQFDNKDINSIHVSPFYKARIVLRIPKDKSVDLAGINYQRIDDQTIMIEYKGTNNGVMYIPHGAIIMSLDAIQSSKKEYFGPVAIEPTADTACANDMFDTIFKTVIVVTVALILMMLLYMCLCGKEATALKPQAEIVAQDIQ